MAKSIGRVYVGVHGEQDEPIWSATNQEIRSDYLVVLDWVLGGKDPELVKHYKDAVEALTEISVARQDLSQNTWLFSIGRSLPDVFNTVLFTVGPEHHSFTVVELSSGEGIGFNSKRRCVYEIYPRRI